MTGTSTRLALATALLVTATVPAAAQDFRWTGRLDQGRTLTIKGVNGGIDVRPASGSEIEVTARKSARRSDPESVRIEVVQVSDGVLICAVYPPGKSDRENRCAEGRDYQMSTNDNDVAVNFDVRLPAGVKLSAQTVNGDVDATQLRSDVDVSTVNGGVSVSTTGLARATTVNGGLKVDMGRADWRGDWSLKTVNGGVEVWLPASAAARVEASTVNGDIETDFPLTVQGKFGPRRLEGTINGGGDRSLSLGTVNGNIEIRRRS